MTQAIEVFLIILLIPFLAIVYFAYLKSKYNYQLKKNADGCVVANELKEKDSIYIIKSNKLFSDSFNPKRNVIKLSGEIYDGKSVYANVLAAYLASFYSDTKIYNLKEKFDKIIKYVNLSSYLVFLLCICLNRTDLMGLAIALNIISLIYYGYLTYLSYEVVDIALYGLKKQKIVKEDEIDSVVSLLKKMPFHNLMSIITNLFDIGG